MPGSGRHVGTNTNRNEVKAQMAKRAGVAAGWRVLVGVGVVVAGSAAWSAEQGAFPVKPLRFVIGTQVGAGSEYMARLVGEPLRQAWGQQYVIDPHPGAGGNIAAVLVAKSAPDGYTLYVCYGTHTVNPSLYARAGFDAVKDFTPIMLIARQPNVLAVHPSVPARNVKELVALAKSRPGKLTYASSGSGSPTHLGMELLKMSAGFDSAHVPYKGAAQANIDLIGGHVDMTFGVMRTLRPFAVAGKLRFLAAASAKRALLEPDLPTLAEAGYKGIEIVTWHGLLGPAGMPAALVSRIQSEARKSILSPEMQQKLSAGGMEPVASTPAEFESFLRADVERWKPVIAKANVRVD